MRFCAANRDFRKQDAELLRRMAEELAEQGISAAPVLHILKRLLAEAHGAHSLLIRLPRGVSFALIRRPPFAQHRVEDAGLRGRPAPPRNRRSRTRGTSGSDRQRAHRTSASPERKVIRSCCPRKGRTRRPQSQQRPTASSARMASAHEKVRHRKIWLIASRGSEASRPGSSPGSPRCLFADMARAAGQGGLRLRAHASASEKLR